MKQWILHYRTPEQLADMTVLTTGSVRKVAIIRWPKDERLGVLEYWVNVDASKLWLARDDCIKTSDTIFFCRLWWRQIAQKLRTSPLCHCAVLLRKHFIEFCSVCSRYFTLLKIIFCFAIPIAVPPLLWDEKWQYSALGMGVVRYVLGLNFTWLVNSAAHIWGNKPYDRWLISVIIVRYIQASWLYFSCYILSTRYAVNGDCLDISVIS